MKRILTILLMLVSIVFSTDSPTVRQTMSDEFLREQKEKEAQRQNRILNFLKNISMIESSGGKNFAHREMESGIHKGHSAAGTYGFMPNTIDEIANRMRQAGQQYPEIQRLLGLSPQEKKKEVEANPELEGKLAEFLAGRVLDRQGDEEKAAYSWFQGHNLSPEKIEKRGYKEHDYVKKYRHYDKLRQQLEEKQARQKELLDLRTNPNNQGLE